MKFLKKPSLLLLAWIILGLCIALLMTAILVEESSIFKNIVKNERQQVAEQQHQRITDATFNHIRQLNDTVTTVSKIMSRSTPKFDDSQESIEYQAKSGGVLILRQYVADKFNIMNRHVGEIITEKGQTSEPSLMKYPNDYTFKRHITKISESYLYTLDTRGLERLQQHVTLYHEIIAIILSEWRKLPGNKSATPTSILGALEAIGLDEGEVNYLANNNFTIPEEIPFPSNQEVAELKANFDYISEKVERSEYSGVVLTVFAALSFFIICIFEGLLFYYVEKKKDRLTEMGKEQFNNFLTSVIDSKKIIDDADLQLLATSGNLQSLASMIYEDLDLKRQENNVKAAINEKQKELQENHKLYQAGIDDTGEMTYLVEKSISIEKERDLILIPALAEIYVDIEKNIAFAARNIIEYGTIADEFYSHKSIAANDLQGQSIKLEGKMQKLNSKIRYLSSTKLLSFIAGLFSSNKPQEKALVS